MLGVRLNRRMRGKLATVIDRIEHGHHVFRAYFKNAFLKQYEKFSTFLRTNWSPTTSPTSVLRRDWTISMPFASASKPSPPASPVSRRNGSTSTSTFRCCSASPCRSPLAQSVIQGDRKSTRLNSSHANISYAVFCLKKKQ